jgi:F-type H+-transporting ATPase subunit b
MLTLHVQETAKLEAETFVQQQQVAVASEVKAVLDSWVRYEQQLKESEQAELTKAVIDKVLASIKDEKTQREVLLGSVAEVEREHLSLTLIANKLLTLIAELVKSKAI